MLDILSISKKKLLTKAILEPGRSSSSSSSSSQYCDNPYTGQLFTSGDGATKLKNVIKDKMLTTQALNSELLYAPIP